mmetsp:Transcript_20739/g.52243  ORF Transcript_20739/g.52243 Transcript_20739/m.52243 type:complete len:124 (-) Transcript_20739:170-541(-)|eukprot:CAMPEP_0178994472 /NCGR_PEP_ID=MMETSP0795-20121207/7288_1 /TAXON_ID=88552 /ORGANISM="Amoebophrya sp., Strain Ameob2" /LENGTH=123 /DNA_ID=CAMNT_0020686667 /DNA_START=69 /DNA_END=440 /DNA_ORIENTATION=+
MAAFEEGFETFPRTTGKGMIDLDKGAKCKLFGIVLETGEKSVTFETYDMVRMTLDVADSAELKNVKTDCVIESLVTLGDIGTGKGERVTVLADSRDKIGLKQLHAITEFVANTKKFPEYAQIF